jgi:biopolymer transport protein ExbD
MRCTLALIIAPLVIFPGHGASAQMTQDCLITIHFDGTCEAAGLHVSCGEIGPKLRQAGIPADAHIRFNPDSPVRYDAVSATVQSVADAGFTNVKIGFITVPAR